MRDEPEWDHLTRALRLVNDVRDLPRGSSEQRLVFMRGLAVLISAEVGIWAEVRGNMQGQPVLNEPIEFGWGSDRERAFFVNHLGTQELGPDPLLTPLARASERGSFVHSRAKLCDDRTWYRSDFVQELRRSAGIDDCLLGGTRRGDVLHGFTLNRPWGEQSFDARDRRIMEIVFSEVAPYLFAPRTLPPRLARVLEALCRGEGEKQIAHELDLSAHTVHGYVKDLYGRFGVRSRGELIAKALSDRVTR